MARLIAWLLELEFAYVVLGLIAGSALTLARRGHFWVRVSLGFVGVVLSAPVFAVARMTSVLPEHMIGAVLLVFAIAALLVGPFFCYRPVSSRGSSESDGGGGSRREPPPPEPSAPRGGIPLDDAEQAKLRIRDHNSPRFSRSGERRPAREPGHTPARTG